MTQTAVRVRFAPSPTGDLHVGGARTALFNWLFARQHGGAFILRIEDTDQARLVGQSITGILESLRWLGLEWDEGPDIGGPYGPYVQSQRLELYQRHARWLVNHGYAYYCFCTPERLEQVRKERLARGEPPGYDRHCRWLPPEEVAERLERGEQAVIRFKMPLEGETVIIDLLRGEIAYDNRVLQDLVLLKSDGFPTYHLANVVDDHFMQITHILRAGYFTTEQRLKLLLPKNSASGLLRKPKGSLLAITHRCSLSKSSFLLHHVLLACPSDQAHPVYN